jgi:hypothetical protein
MKMRCLLRRVRHWICYRQIEAELAEEIESHRAMHQARLERSGMRHEDAAIESRRLLGNMTLAREDAREVWIWPSLERLWQDIRYGARGIRQQPIFAATAISTLAVGIAATTTAFSIVEAELLRPLPFPEAERLVAASVTAPGSSRMYEPVSLERVFEWRAQNRTFDELAAFGVSRRRVLRGTDLAEFVRTTAVTSNFLPALRWHPAVGRNFAPGDDAAVI